MKRRNILIGIAAAVVAAVAAFLLIRQPPVDEVVELAVEGGERVLREPMRPSRGSTRVLIIALDGVGADQLMNAIEQGDLPNLASLMGASVDSEGTFEHGYAVPDVLSVLPSTTLAAWTALFTGRPPAENGVPGNEWFDRRQARYLAPAPVSVSGVEQALEVYTESLFDDLVAVPTLYERADVRSYVSMMHVHRGADLLSTPDAGALDELMTGFIEGITEETEVSQGIYQNLDDVAADGVVNADERYGIPDLQTLYMPGIDLFTHVAEGPLEAQRQYLRTVIDPALGRVLTAYRNAGVLDSTFVVIVSDHGHTPVIHDDRHALEATGDDEPPLVLEQTGYRLRPFRTEIDDDERDFQATVAYQGAFGYVYLADRSLCPEPGDVCDWSAPPRFEEDVLPVIRAYEAANESGAGAPQLRGTIDLILSREPRPVDQDALPFQVWDGSALVPIADYLARNPRPELLDFERRMAGLAAGPYGHRAGDILLMARSGSAREVGERFYFSHPYRSWHGSATEGDSRVPLVVIGPARSGAEIRDQVRGAIDGDPSHLDVVPVVLDLLGVDPR